MERVDARGATGAGLTQLNGRTEISTKEHEGSTTGRDGTAKAAIDGRAAPHGPRPVPFAINAVLKRRDLGEEVQKARLSGGVKARGKADLAGTGISKAGKAGAGEGAAMGLQVVARDGVINATAKATLNDLVTNRSSKAALEEPLPATARRLEHRPRCRVEGPDRARGENRGLKGVHGFTFGSGLGCGAPQRRQVVPAGQP